MPKELIVPLVEDCLKQHVGGAKFFDDLDSRVNASEFILEALFNLAIIEASRFDREDFGPIGLVVSGKMGQWYKRFFH